MLISGREMGLCGLLDLSRSNLEHPGQVGRWVYIFNDCTGSSPGAVLVLGRGWGSQGPVLGAGLLLGPALGHCHL